MYRLQITILPRMHNKPIILVRDHECFILLISREISNLMKGFCGKARWNQFREFLLTCCNEPQDIGFRVQHPPSQRYHAPWNLHVKTTLIPSFTASMINVGNSTLKHLPSDILLFLLHLLALWRELGQGSIFNMSGSSSRTDPTPLRCDSHYNATVRGNNVMNLGGR